jgi:hypothetical protein
MHPGDAKMVFLVPELAYACPPGKVFTRPSSIPDTKQRERRGSVKRFFFFFCFSQTLQNRKLPKKKISEKFPFFSCIFLRGKIYILKEVISPPLTRSSTLCSARNPPVAEWVDGWAAC